MFHDSYTSRQFTVLVNITGTIHYNEEKDSETTFYVQQAFKGTRYAQREKQYIKSKQFSIRIYPIFDFDSGHQTLVLVSGVGVFLVILLKLTQLDNGKLFNWKLKNNTM